MLFGATNHPQMLFFSALLRFILVFKNSAKFTGVNRQFVRRKTIREHRQIFLPYMSFRPYVLPPNHVESVDVREIVDGGVGWVGCKYVDQVTFFRIGQN